IEWTRMNNCRSSAQTNSGLQGPRGILATLAVGHFERLEIIIIIIIIIIMILSISISWFSNI
ncbi:hypothetical protein ACMBCM_08875, partial [Spiroplasma sp. K1]